MNVSIGQLNRQLLRAAVARAGCERGQALVELALILPVLLLGVVGIVSFGRAMNYDEQETHLVNQAARYAAVNQLPAGASGQTLGQWLRAQADSPELKNGTGSVQARPTVCISYPQGTSVGSPATVSMSFGFYWVPVLQISPASTTVQRTASMRIEVPPTNSFFASGCS
jgi:Flp pilus assembly protein TadG